jgi:peroxiredoxin
MSEFARLRPSAPVPALRVGTVGGPCWRLCDQKPKHFTLVLFYRGLHCPFCMEQLKQLEEKVDEFHKRGVRVLAVSADTRDRAERAAEEWGIDKLTICWGLTLDQAKAWGLYVSAGRGKSPRGVEEPPFFVEPALFLVRPDGTLYSGMVQTMPFARPHLDDVLAMIDYVVARDFPPRGEYEGDEIPGLAAE